MKGVEQPITYFEQAGYENTSDVVEIAYPGSRRPRALPVDECASVWPACPELRRGMSPRWGVK